MPDHNGQAGEDGFIVVYGQGNVDRPAGQKLGHIDFEPNHQSGYTHDDRTPDDGPVFHFLSISESSDSGPLAAEATQVLGILAQVLQVFWARQQIFNQTPPLLFGENIIKMIGTREEEDYPGNA